MDAATRSVSSAENAEGVEVSVAADKRKRSLSGVDNERRLVERRGLEPLTSALRTQRSPN